MASADRRTVPVLRTWRDEYHEALNKRDEREQAPFEFLDAYTRLADHAAALEAEKAARSASSAQQSSTQQTPAANENSGEGNAQLRADLAEALRSKSQLQGRLKIAEDELLRLREKTKADSKTIKDLSTERNVLSTKVRDRDEELKAKAKLLEDLQDETISLNLQINVAEQKAAKLQKENKDLIDRWMARMGQEADALNRASNF